MQGFQPLSRAVERVTEPRTPASTPPVIDVNGVTRAFTEDAGVFNLNFQVAPGTIFGLIGSSGSGKTTTVRLLTGLLKPDSGALMVLGEIPLRFRGRTRERLAYMPQNFVLYPNLTVWENINFVASLYGIGYLKRRKRIRNLLDLVELTDVRHRLGSQLSGGMQRRLELASALVNDPQLVFADEPTAGVDPVLRAKFWEHFRGLRDEGRTLFITTQYVSEAEYCDVVGVMREGRLIALDSPDALRRRAMGGEVIKLVVAAPRLLDAVQLLQQQPTVSDVQRSRAEPGLLYVYTDDAAAALPQVLEALSTQPNIQVQQAEKYLPSFDDVFVRLMERV